jgi:hypothetical protein
MTVRRLRGSKIACAPRGASCARHKLCPLAQMRHICICANEHSVCVGVIKEYPMENALLEVFIFIQLSKRETRLSISPTSLTAHGRSHVKKFYTNNCLVQHCGESSPHQPGYHGLAGWFHITIESDANREYSWLVRSVSPRFVF